MNLECGTIAEWTAFLNEALEPQRLADLESHLVSCASCETQLNSLSADACIADFRSAYVRGLREQTARHLQDPAITQHEAGLEFGPELLPSKVHTEFQQESDPVSSLKGFSRFTKLHKVGAGGFGTVYRAYDPTLRRDVALKIPHAATLASVELKHRFEREARAVAALHHPNIIQVFEAGIVGADACIVSEYCSGQTLREYLDGHCQGVPADVAVDIVICIAAAIEHAHERQLLHRDLKPENVLLDFEHACETLAFTPLLTDFGVARFLDDVQRVTVSGMLVGTPRYMSPEQADGRLEEIGPASDQFALGVILYELLTGQTPFESANTLETLRRIIVEPAAPLQAHQPSLSIDLNAICNKCLEKNPADRYESVSAFIADLRRYRAGEATLARPLRAIEKLQRWLSQNKLIATTVVTLVVSALLVAMGAMIFASEQSRLNRQLAIALADTEESRRAAEASDLHSRRLLYVSDMQRGAQAWRSKDLYQVAEIVQLYSQDSRTDYHRGLEWQLVKSIIRPPSRELAPIGSPLYGVRYTRDGKHLMVWGEDSCIRILNPGTGAVIRELPTEQVEVNSIDLSPDGKWLAAAGDDGTVRIFNYESGQLLKTFTGHAGKVFGVCYLGNDRDLASCGTDGRI